ncbi:MAG: tRNA (adenosine(37)-N6)-threonylcarbamoyltransferase complex transferase subunit TsaD [Ignavibacteria bacterium]
MLHLAFETSCDETSVALLDNDSVVMNLIYSQMEHQKFGGVVPEIASREHLKKIQPLTEKIFSDTGRSITELNFISATNEPGLIGALLIGLNYARALALALDIPFVPVNHLHAHIYSAFLRKPSPEFPFIALVVSGGHTLLVLVKNYFDHQILGTTVDDAAGEAFDKVAKLLGLGYPGGPEISRLARDGNENAYKFPIARLKHGSLNFSFSGIKTSVLYFLRDNNLQQPLDKKILSDLCASFQKSVINSLYKNTLRALEEFKVKSLVISGGVSANYYLREKFLSLKSTGYNIFIPPHEYTTDNAAMIGITAYYKYLHTKDKKFYDLQSFAVTAKARLDFNNF